MGSKLLLTCVFLLSSVKCVLHHLERLFCKHFSGKKNHFLDKYLSKIFTKEKIETSAIIFFKIFDTPALFEFLPIETIAVMQVSTMPYVSVFQGKGQLPVRS